MLVRTGLMVSTITASRWCLVVWVIPRWVLINRYADLFLLCPDGRRVGGFIAISVCIEMDRVNQENCGR